MDRYCLWRGGAINSFELNETTSVQCFYSLKPPFVRILKIRIGTIYQIRQRCCYNHPLSMTDLSNFILVRVVTNYTFATIAHRTIHKAWLMFINISALQIDITVVAER